jgi:hypothetical protein
MMSIRTLVGAALVSAAAVAAASSQASANLIADGNFNGNPPTAGEQYFINYSTPIDGVWNILDNNVDVVGAVSPSAPYGWSTPSGACCSVDLVGTGTTGGIDQSFNVKSAGTYTVSFEFANNFWSTAAASAKVEVGTSAGGSSLLSGIVSHSSSGPSGMNWTLASYTFFASEAGTLWLSFDTIFGSNDGGIVLTDINVNQTPLPAAFALFAGGLGVIGLFSRRKNRKPAAAIRAA